MHRHFARTNEQTITQRSALLAVRLPHVHAIGELCCGDCTRQHAIYNRMLMSPLRYHGMDIDPAVTAFNHQQGVACSTGDVMNLHALRTFLDDDLLFFGPPLSVNCDGHHLLAFEQVTPGYLAFATLLLGELAYTGAVVFICPRTTNPGHMATLHACVQALRPDMGLGLIHRSYSMVTGSGEVTEPRLKYVELWYSPTFADLWEVVATGVGE